MLNPEVIAQKVFDIVQECEHLCHMTDYWITLLEDRLTTIVEDDYVDVVVRAGCEGGLEVTLAEAWPSQRGNEIVAHFAELCNKPVRVEMVETGKW